MVLVLASIMAKGTEAQEQKHLEETMKKLKESWEKQGVALSGLSKMVV